VDANASRSSRSIVAARTYAAARITGRPAALGREWPAHGTSIGLASASRAVSAGHRASCASGVRTPCSLGSSQWTKSQARKTPVNKRSIHPANNGRQCSNTDGLGSDSGRGSPRTLTDKRLGDCAANGLPLQWEFVVSKFTSGVNAPMSGRVRARVWELDLLQARNGVMQWLVRTGTENSVAFSRERGMRDRNDLPRSIAHRHAKCLTSGELDRPYTDTGSLLLPARQRALALPKDLKHQRGDALRGQSSITRALAHL